MGFESAFLPWSEKQQLLSAARATIREAALPLTDG
jgi:hypothetical protein